MSNTFSEPVDMGHTPADLRARAEIVVDRLGGGRVNHRTGLFEVLVREASLANGERLQPFTIKGQTLTFLAGLRAAAGDVRLVPSFCAGTSGTLPVSYGQPHLLFDDVPCFGGTHARET